MGDSLKLHLAVFFSVSRFTNFRSGAYILKKGYDRYGSSLFLLNIYFFEPFLLILLRVICKGGNLSDFRSVCVELWVGLT